MVVVGVVGLVGVVVGVMGPNIRLCSTPFHVFCKGFVIFKCAIVPIDKWSSGRYQVIVSYKQLDVTCVNRHECEWI